MFYKVRFEETEFDDNGNVQPFTYIKVFEVSSEKKLQEKISAYIDEITDAVGKVAEIRKVSAEEVIEDTKQTLFEEIFRKYLRVKLKPKKLDPQKYAELKNKYLHDPKYFYQMLQYEIKSMRVEDYLGRYNPHFTHTLKDISAKQYFDRVIMLSEGDPDTIGG